ncbi:MAG: peptide ABC transporter substrate-binding protein, partial [Firmicutes bacterium]|nr:peptide ABC transporter substrate-binding protein [Bacillota bacterium]
MKKFISLLLAVCMIFALAACGGSKTEEPAPAATTPAPAQTNTPAPAPAAEEPFVLNASIASEPETIDPGLISSVDGSTYTQHQFENLMKYQMTDEAFDESGNLFGTEIVLGQAASYEVSDDLTVYTFKLRDDAVWSDGQPVKAQDFVYSWRRLVDPETASDYGYFLDGIVKNAAAIQAGEVAKEELGIEALDDKTLQITLEAPC